MKKQGRIYRFTTDEREHISNILSQKKWNYRQDDILLVINGLEKLCHYYMVSFSGQEKPSEHIKDLKRTVEQIQRSHDAILEQAGRDHRHTTLEKSIVFETDPADKIREKFDALAEASRLRVAYRAIEKQVVGQTRPLQKEGGRPGADADGLGYLILSLLRQGLKWPRVAVWEAVTAACLEAVELPAKDPSRRVKAARKTLAKRGISPIIDEKILS